MELIKKDFELIAFEMRKSKDKRGISYVLLLKNEYLQNQALIVLSEAISLASADFVELIRL